MRSAAVVFAVWAVWHVYRGDSLAIVDVINAGVLLLLAGAAWDYVKGGPTNGSGG